MAKSRICKIDGCDKTVRGKGWCAKHYMRWHRHGDPTIVLNRYGQPSAFLEDVVRGFDGADCLIWPFDRNAKGYGRHHTGGKRVAAHRIACEMRNGPPPTAKHSAAHSCGKGHLGCVNPKHIRWATPKENHADKQIHGTIARGEKNGNAVMSEATAKKVKSMIGTMVQREIAERLGITRSSVRDIKIGKTWGWL